MIYVRSSYFTKNLSPNRTLLFTHDVPFTDLYRAAEAEQREIVHLIYETKPDLDLFTTCDHNGRNVFHYAVRNADVPS